MSAYFTGDLTSAESRSRWVREQVQFAKDNFLDGVNLDFKSPIPQNEPDNKTGYTLLVQELADAFRQEFISPQVAMVTSLLCWCN